MLPCVVAQHLPPEESETGGTRRTGEDVREDKVSQVRGLAAFAIGEIESGNGANALLGTLKTTTETSEVKARAIEGLGKIAAALPKEQQAQATEIANEILATLKSESERSSPDRQLVLLGITAA